MKKVDAFKFDFEPMNLPLRRPSKDNSAIYMKIDWLTVIFNDVTLFDVLEFLHLTDNVADFFKDQMKINQGYEDFILFKYEGCTIQCSETYFYGQSEMDDIFSLVCPKVRLDLSGSGLDFLRSTGLDPDKYFRNPDNYPQPFHLTRCDFAFDFINYAETLLDEVVDYCLKNHTDADRVCIYKHSPGTKYRYVQGGQKTLYLGSTTSERMLRIYDKRLQFIDQISGLYKKENPYNDPESWIRIELQLRKLTANRICFSPSDASSILKYIYEQYCFVEPGTTSHNRKPAQFWLSLFDWEKIPQIIQNFDKVDHVSAEDRAVSALISMLSTFRRGYCVLGAQGWCELNEAYDTYLNDKQNPLARKKLMRIFNQLNECGVEVSPYSDGYYNANPFGSEPYYKFRMKGIESNNFK